MAGWKTRVTKSEIESRRRGQKKRWWGGGLGRYRSDADLRQKCDMIMSIKERPPPPAGQVVRERALAPLFQLEKSAAADSLKSSGNRGRVMMWEATPNTTTRRRVIIRFNWNYNLLLSFVPLFSLPLHCCRRCRRPGRFKTIAPPNISHRPGPAQSGVVVYTHLPRLPLSSSSSSFSTVVRLSLSLSSISLLLLFLRLEDQRRAERSAALLPFYISPSLSALRL